MFGSEPNLSLYNDNRKCDFDAIAKKVLAFERDSYGIWPRAMRMSKQKHKAFDKDEKKTKSDRRHKHAQVIAS